MDIIQFFLLISDESYCVELLRRARWSGLVTCPHCNCNSIKRYGRYKICFQRYFCYRCRCTFNDKTGTVFHYSHIPLSKWFCHIWLFCISSLIGTSIRQISKSLEMQYRTSYHMTRKIMQKLFDSQKALTINGECEADEMYVHAGMKGKSYHDKIMESGRLPRRRAIKPPLGRGRFSRDFPMVMCYHQRGGDTILEVPQNYPSIAELVCSTIQKGSRINTDEYSVYDSLQQRGFEHHCINHGLKEYARDDIHTNNCECRTNLLRLWLSKHMGINKYNLNLYVKTFQFLHNHRNLDDYSKFIKIISVVYLATRFDIMSESL